jgi:hypothetical protein
MDIDGDGGRREFGLRGQRRGTESIIAEMVERCERMGVIAWFCCHWEQPEARTRQKTARNNAFEQRTGLIRVVGKFTSQPNSHLWLRCACSSRATEVNRQASGEDVTLSPLPLAYLRLIVRKFTKLGLPLWCSHCQESPVLKVEGSRGSCREMDQMFNLFVRNRMVWLEDICGATVFDYVLQCLIHDFLL